MTNETRERPKLQVVTGLLGPSLTTYTSRTERAALRSALGDAAGLCDWIARDIVQEHRGNHGKGATTKRGRELEAVAKRCADAIWALRDHIKVPA